jgi:predicted O-methyltransferase YrrM
VTILEVAQRAIEPLSIRGNGRFAEQILRRARTETPTCRPLRGLVAHLRRSQRIERLMWAGAYERKLVSLVKKIVRPAMMVLDVGANIGYVAAIAAKLTGDGGQVHAFEPNPRCYACLRGNLRPFSHAHAHQSAVSDSEGTLPLFLSDDLQEDGWASLLDEPGVRGALSKFP